MRHCPFYIKMIKSMLPFILSIPKLMKLSKQYGNMTSSEFAAKYFEKGSKLFKLFRGFSYPDLPSMFVAAASAGIEDIWTVKDGMQSWADILAENFRELGGELKLNSYVDRIITKNGPQWESHVKISSMTQIMLFLPGIIRKPS